MLLVTLVNLLKITDRP